MNITHAARTQNPFPGAQTSLLREDDAIAALTHLYLELQLPPQSAWRAAQADCRAAASRSGASDRPCNVNIGELP